MECRAWSLGAIDLRTDESASFKKRAISALYVKVNNPHPEWNTNVSLIKNDVDKQFEQCP
jgi:hypothetical protein